MCISTFLCFVPRVCVHIDFFIDFGSLITILPQGVVIQNAILSG
jgi:hypothetical protein